MSKTPSSASSRFITHLSPMHTHSLALQNALTRRAAGAARGRLRTNGKRLEHRIRLLASQLRLRGNNFGLVAFFQVHRVDAGFFGQLFEEAVQALLIDSVVLHAFGLFRDLCDQTLQFLR